MEVCVIGGGNIGTLVCAEMAAQPNISVRLFTHDISLWNHVIDVYDGDDHLLYSSYIDYITDSLADAVRNADIIFTAMPSHVIAPVIKNLHGIIKKGAKLVFLPGTGGKEFITKSVLNKECTMIGLQRVHSIARVKQYGHSVYMLGKKDKLYVSVIPQSNIDESCSLLTQLFGIECVKLKNYLAVTLTPSNPILHTARLFSMFMDEPQIGAYSKAPLFYEDWDFRSAEILFQSDKELQTLCKALNRIDLSEVVSLKNYYESDTPEDFVKKIKSIQCFKGIKSPMVTVKNGYMPDYNSRYFKEDFPFGLLIIKGFADILKVATPTIDDIIRWVQTVLGKSYLTESGLNGKDIFETGIPQNFGIKTVDDVYKFYLS